MSVTESFTLPAQPNNGGAAHFRPLGGDGFTAPQSMYLVDDAELEADVSGGTSLISIIMDDQYESLIQSVTLQVTSVADAPLFSFRIRNPAITDHSVWVNGAMPIFNTVARITWVPSPMFGIEKVTFQIDNVDTEDMFASLVVFNFKKRASELIPLNILLASLPRAASLL